ncbi:translation initiation factor IF-2-like [Hordeum vulgare subsp. vulgare]|uniref:translation initiation factor IF-2-like n=1 Tax=Hordeum vulgare subsp. vulgare TaxID=112509 RepID=UPI001D1A469C|nr:translation initiation factor IF-2-like [Hordeum vulgare subsp. vulgare]
MLPPRSARGPAPPPPPASPSARRAAPSWDAPASPTSSASSAPPRRACANDMSDLYIDKPAVRSLPLSAAVGDPVATVRKGPRATAAAYIAVGPMRGAVVGRAGLADILCLLCSSPAVALDRPVSALLPKDSAGEVRRVVPIQGALKKVLVYRTECKGTGKCASI